MNTWLPGIPWVWQMANVVASFFVVILFAVIYKFFRVVISWNDVWISAAVTALLFSGGKYAIGISSEKLRRRVRLERPVHSLSCCFGFITLR